MAKAQTPSRIDMDSYAAQYGWSYAMFNSNPELRKLLIEAVKNSYDEGRFTAKLRNTSWYKKHGETARKTILLQKTDPAEYARRHSQLAEHIRQLYNQKSGGAASEKWIRSAADQAMMLGWTEEEINHHIAADTGYKTLLRQDRLGGEAGQAEHDIKKLAGDYGVSVSSDWMANRIRNIMLGTDSIESVQDYMRHYAKTKYRAFADEIDKGATVRDIAEPYVQSMAKILEIPDGGVDLSDSLVQKALTKYNVDNGKPDPMPIWQFEQDLRNDPRWTKTQNAQDSLMSVGHSLLQQFGIVS